MQCCIKEQRRIGAGYKIDPEFTEMKIEREIDQVKTEVLNDPKFKKILNPKYELKNGSSENDFPICKGCGNELTSSDLSKLFPE